MRFRNSVSVFDVFSQLFCVDLLLLRCVIQSGSCAVSYAEGEDGDSYILCTGNSSSSWQCIGDQTVLYADAMKNDKDTGYSVSAAESNSGGIDEE